MAMAVAVEGEEPLLNIVNLKVRLQSGKLTQTQLAREGGGGQVGLIMVHGKTSAHAHQVNDRGILRGQKQDHQVPHGITGNQARGTHDPDLVEEHKQDHQVPEKAQQGQRKIPVGQDPDPLLHIVDVDGHAL